MPGDVHVELLGGFRVVVDGREAADWPTRRAQELVQLLALSETRRLVRDQVIEQLWPHLGAEAGGANLRKAAHHARRTLGDPRAVVLRGGGVEVFPDRVVRTDVEQFLHDAADALADGSADACARVAATCAGELLPEAPYESWTQEPRRRVREQRAALLRRCGDWEGLVAVEPTDEPAYRELMRAALRDGSRHSAIRWYERLRLALASQLGVRPSAETRALYDECTAGIALGEAAFVGRAIELAAAMAALARARAGEPSALLLRGPAGIGKSALAREIARRARDAGWRVIATQGSAAAAPYAPLSTAVEQLLADGHGALATLPQRTRSVLAELTPVAAPAPPLRGALTRHQVIAAVRRALWLADDPPPTLVLVEDAQLCDQATADVLHQLLSGAAGGRLLIVLAERTGATAGGGLARIAAHVGTEKLDIGPLRAAEITTLVAHTAADDAALRRIQRLAEGSPFFALELARAAATHDTGALPGTVREAITERFADLDTATMTALTQLAVASGELDLASVLALTGLDEPRAFATLDAALEAGVLVVSDTRYRFRHELVRQALTDQLAPHRRMALHRDAAQRLIQAGGAPALIARHWLDGGEPVQAVPWLLAAARRAAGLGAFADALAHVEALLDAEPEHHEALVLRAEVLDALGDARAPAAYAAAAGAVGEPEAQDLRARQALAQIKASDPGGALRTLEGLQPRSTAGLLAHALTLSAAAAIGWYADADTAAAKAAEAHELAVRLDDPGAILDATWAQALASHAKGELPARLRRYLRSTHELPELATRVFDGQLCVTERMLFGGLPNDEIIAFADALAAEAERLGAARGHAFALTLRGEAEILAGRLDDADRDFAAGARLHGQIGAVAGEALSLMGRAQVAVYRGRPERAQPWLADALLMARESEVGHHTLDRIYGTMVSAAADPEQAVEIIREAETAIVGPAETCPTCRIAFVVPAAIAAAQAGDLERARRYAADAQTAIDVVALPPAWGAATHEALGWVARAGGDVAGARSHFQSAAEGFDTWGQPLDAERCARLAAAAA